MTKKLTKEEFINRSNEIHNNLYDYSKVNYINANEKVIIICKTHGEFEQTPGKHMIMEQKCPSCKFTKLSKTFSSTTEEFIQKATDIHGNKYSYDKVVYVNNREKVEIYCKVCKDYFTKSPGKHIYKADPQGCTVCSRKKGNELKTGLTKNILFKNIIDPKEVSILNDRYPNAGIYRIKNTENGKVYIGSSFDVQARWFKHINQLSKGDHPNIKLLNAWIKYGGDKFVFELITKCLASDLTRLEQKYIDESDCTENGYNIQSIAGGSALGVKRSEETKRKMSEAQKGKPRPPLSEKALLAYANRVGKPRGPYRKTT